MSHEGLIFILPAAIAIRLLRKRTGDVIDPADLWVPCWRNLHPRWLLIYHAFSFLAVAFYLYQTVAEFGFFVFFFYTQWTFALLMVYFACEIKLQAVTMEKDRGKSINKPSNEKITNDQFVSRISPLIDMEKGAEISLSMSGVDEKFGKCLWCGDVTVDRLKWGNEFLKTRMGAKSDFDVSPETLRRVQRVKQLTAMSERVATGLLSGVVKVSGFFTSSVANSKVGQKFFSLLPGEIVLSSLDGFST